jgi:hypothetical protein
MLGVVRYSGRLKLPYDTLVYGMQIVYIFKITS